jgi:hypothetical protein
VVRELASEPLACVHGMDARKRDIDTSGSIWDDRDPYVTDATYHGPPINWGT